LYFQLYTMTKKSVITFDAFFVTIFYVRQEQEDLCDVYILK
jgi:hypothetical protein